MIRSDFPNGTFSRVEFTPWQQITHDQNDTATDSDWYDARIGYVGGDESLLAEKRAAELTEDHAGTPTVVHLDVLGRPFLSIAHNKDPEDDPLFYETKSVLDIQGNLLQVIDARTNIAEQRIYGMLGQSLEVISHDAGDRQILLNALGQPMRTWDSRNRRFSHTYDTLRRPVDRTVSVSGGGEILLGRIVYGDLLSTPAGTNHVGRVYRIYDGAGVATTLEFDFKGNALDEQRQLVLDQTTQPDWSDLLGESTIAAMATAVSSLLDSETFSASSQRDALNRVLVAISPDDSHVLYTYDEGGALQQVEVKHRGSSTAETVVGDITYNARGQRESVTYGSTGSPTTITTYEYDPQTFRLSRLTTERDSDSATLQDLYYHYDPVGNVTDIRDEAQQTVYFQNSVVEAANSYTYDAVYRLIEATGREHSTQGTTQRTDVQISVGPQPMTSDPSAMRRYTQKYTYDEVGNILTMQHLPASGSGWTRHYVYDEEGNRLEETSAPGDDPEGPYSHSYTYDTHGNMTEMPHLSSMVWNHLDELQKVEVGSETVYFQYAGGQRSRKYVEKTGTTTEERIYLGSFEIYRKRINGSIDIERESLHISDGTGRICIIETKTVDGGSAVGSPAGIWRYQLGNHLGSAAVEVDENGDIISYEEYHPYGTSAYRAVDSSIDVSAKRYRYTGMERDEETSLEYHSARYYAPWLGRWTAADPLEIADAANRYFYADGCPVISVDKDGLSANWIGSLVGAGVRAAKQLGRGIGAAGRTAGSAVARTGKRVADKVTAENYGGGGDADLDLNDGDGPDFSDDGGNSASPPHPQEKTKAEYEAEAYRAWEQQFDAADARYYERGLIIDFIPLMGLRDLRHDASQLRAAIQMGDEDRAATALKRVSVDVITTVVDVVTLGSDRLVMGAVSRTERRSVTLAAQGGSGEARHEAKASIKGAPVAGEIADPALRTGWKPGKNDADWRGTGKTQREALDAAFELTGVPRSEFEITMWGRDSHGKSFPVEYRSPNGAEVNVDLGHTNNGPGVPHVGWQTPGKRKNGGGERGHILLDDVPYNR